MQNIFKIGIVENRDDPLRLGRCQVRVFGLHTHDKTILPTSDLPWASQLNPNSASMNGIGISSTHLVEGTSVVVGFMDEEYQYPIIFGSISGIPQEKSKLIDTDEDEYSVKVQSDIVFVEPEMSVAEAPDEVDPQVISSTEIDSNPGIAALNKAMDDAGITSEYARASILGICQVESNFRPVAENLNYSAEALLKTFPSAFKNDLDLAKAVERKPRNIAEVVYGPERGKGKELGNTVIGDGYKFRGRGYVQLTGKANYQKYSSIAGIDLISKPDSLLQEDIAAKVTVQYFKDRVRESEDSPNYFNAAVKAVGLNRSDILEKKKNAYQYFLGDTNSVAQTDKSTDTSDSVAQHNDSIKIDGKPLDRISNEKYGFSDPKFKYPLKKYLNEPDTNRLARGRISGTIVENKDKTRIKSVPVADGTSWSQPISPYNSLYPYNHVYESESGHVMEYDDTPNNERIHTYHRKGTFQEIDANGTRVTRIVGDNYEILDRNGFIYISGDANITVAGNINIISQSDVNIKVHGNTNLNVHGNMKTNVAGSHDISVGGAMKIKAADFILETDGNLDIKAGDKLSLDSVRTDINNDTSRETGLSKISSLKTVKPKFKKLSTPPRRADEIFIFESPEELIGTKPPVIADAMPEKQSAPVIKPIPKTVENIPQTCAAFANMTDFPNSMVLHRDSTGYDWTLGKLLNGKTLKEITVKGKTYSKADIVCNLKTLSENVLGKLNELIGRVDSAWVLSSIYRNDIPPGGSATSQHLTGQACDFVIGNNFNYDAAYKWAQILSTELNYDQFLYEFLDGADGRKNWIHISYTPGGGRRQVLTFLNHKTAAQGLKRLA